MLEATIFYPLFLFLIKGTFLCGRIMVCVCEWEKNSVVTLNRHLDPSLAAVRGHTSYSICKYYNTYLCMCSYSEYVSL